MKRHLTLLLVLMLICVGVRAEIANGTYYIQSASGTFIEAGTTGSSNPGARFRTGSRTAFRIEAVAGGYTIQNASNGNYLLYSTANNWNTMMSANSNEASYGAVWTIAENGGKYVISRKYNGSTYYLGNGNTNNGTGVFSGETSPVSYSLVVPEDPSAIPTGITLYLIDGETSLALMQKDSYTSDTKAQFQEEGSPLTFAAVSSVENGYTIALNGTGKYLSCNHNGSTGWNAVSSATPYTWIIEPVADGWTIKASTKGSGAGLYLGNANGSSVGAGIYSNQTSAFIWNVFTQEEYENHLALLVKTYTIYVAGLNDKGGVKYNGIDYYHGENFVVSGSITTGVLAPIEVAGYQAEVTMDGTEIMVTYIANQKAENPQAVSDLLNRIGGAGTAARFVTRLDEGLFQNGKDFFRITSAEGKPCIEGSSLSAITSGIGWYLNHYAHVNLSWNMLTTDLSGVELPLPASEETHTCDAGYRYYLNYCTFGYSMTSWTWDRWQKEIDWMALHGINMPLQIVGLEEVWRQTLVADGYTNDAAKAFAAGPAFIAWWGMNNLQGWGGTSDDAWFARQAKLGKDICDRMRELGMQPVLPGFSGMVPAGYAGAASQGNWCGTQRPYILDPTNEKFATLAVKYYEKLNAVLGASKYYSMDPFHEGGSISSGKYSEAYTSIYEAMNTNCGSNTKWVIQQWQWSGNQKLSLNAVPAGRLIVLDLFSDGTPAFDSYNGYAPQEAVFCTIPNFGGRSGFMGRLDNMTSNYFTFKGKYNSIKGIGAAPEAIESVPVVYDLLFELPWMDAVPDVKNWVADYATNRYGVENANTKDAWENIRQSAMAFGADAIQGPIEDVWAARPNLDANPASSWGKTISAASGIYTTAKREKLISAVYSLVGESDNLSGSNYQYDLIEAGSQVMADYAYDLLLGIKAAKTAGNTTLFNQRKEAFLNLILGMDGFKGTHQMFRLGNWTQMARDAADEVTGATDVTRDWYELNNARTLITTWGDKSQSEGGGLRDYSYRSWQGLLKDYYYPRWEYYFNHDCTAPASGWFYSEWNWAHELEGEWGASAKGTKVKDNRTYYSATPEGNTVEEAEKLLQKYILPIKTADGNAYAYRVLTNNFSSRLTIVAEAGDEIVMPVDGNTDTTDGIVTASLKVDGADIDGFVLPKDMAKGEHNAEYILSDGTVVKFKINIGNQPIEDKCFAHGDGAQHSFKVADVAPGVGSLKSTGTWEIDIEAEVNDTQSFNQWGSTLIANGTDPFNNYAFQIYMSKNSDIKVNAAATSVSVKENFSVKLKYDGTNLYVNIVGKDANGNPAEYGANNSKFITKHIADITDLCYALPEGIEIKTLTITADYEEDPDGVNDASAEAVGKMTCYDLSGRKVAQPVKGQIYIINNKKVEY